MDLFGLSVEDVHLLRRALLAYRVSMETEARGPGDTDPLAAHLRAEQEHVAKLHGRLGDELLYKSCGR